MTGKILIISTNQFGYHIHTHKYAEFLKNYYDVTYLCWDYGFPKLAHQKLEVKYIHRSGNKLTRYYKFLKAVNSEIRSGKYDLVFIKYFYVVSLVKLLNRKTNFNIDIRTNSIKPGKLSRYLYDSILKFECSFFKHVTIISGDLAKSLKLKNWHVVPLGGDCFAHEKKNFEKIHLLYVGTLYQRNIIECVKGFHEYIRNNPPGNNKDLFFTIVGNSKGNEEEEIRNYVSTHQLDSYIDVTGYIYYKNLSPYFEKANVGISFVPITQYFDNQPPTKTYEYLVSGMPVIATGTRENAKIMKDDCGIIIKDNLAAFAGGLKKIIDLKRNYDSNHIKDLYKENSWDYILNHNLKDYVNKLIN